MAALETMACGCKFGTESDAFIIEACAAGEDCPTVQFVIAETERQGKPYSVLDLDFSDINREGAQGITSETEGQDG